MKTITSKNWDRSSNQLLARRLLRRATLVSSIIASLFLTATMLAAPPWSPPITLSYPAVNAHGPAVAVNDSGAMVATWIRQEGSLYQVQASINIKGSWSAPVNLSPGGQGAFECSVAIDSNRVATAVWTVGETIQASTFNPAGKLYGWSVPVKLSEVGVSTLSPHVVVDAAGNVTVMWVRYDMSGVPRVESVYRPAHGNWSAPLVVAPGAPRDLMLVTNDNGDAAAIWDLGSFGSGTAIYVSTHPRLQLTTGWSAPYLVAPVAYRQGGGKIGIAANGDITACWRTNTDIRTADKPARGNWGTTKVVYSSNAVSAYPTLAVTPSGDAMAAWTTYVFVGGSYNYQIRTGVRLAGGNWSVAAPLTSSGEYDLELNAATSKGGTCLLTWVDVNSSFLKTSTWDIKKGWYGYGTISSGSDTALAVGGNTALAIWMAGAFQATVSTAPIAP